MSILGGLIGLNAASGLLSGIGGIMSANNQLTATRETNAQNYKIWREQVEENLNQWNRENEYNTPLAQRERLEEAGYNPLSGQDTGNASSMSVPEAPQMVAPDASAVRNPLDTIGNLLSQTSQNVLGMINAQKHLENETNKTNADINNLNVMSELAKYDYDFKKATDKFRVRTVEAGAKKAEAEAYVADGTKESLVKQVDLQNSVLGAQKANLDLDANSKKIMNKYLDEKQQNELLIQSQELYNLQQQGKLTEAQVRYTIANTIKVYAEANGIKLNNYVLSHTADGIIRATNMSNTNSYLSNFGDAAIQNTYNQYAGFVNGFYDVSKFPGIKINTLKNIDYQDLMYRRSMELSGFGKRGYGVYNRKQDNYYNFDDYRNRESAKTEGHMQRGAFDFIKGLFGQRYR